MMLPVLNFQVAGWAVTSLEKATAQGVVPDKSNNPGCHAETSREIRFEELSALSLPPAVHKSLPLRVN
jgi:hypothetical protein